MTVWIGTWKLEEHLGNKKGWNVLGWRRVAPHADHWEVQTETGEADPLLDKLLDGKIVNAGLPNLVSEMEDLAQTTDDGLWQVMAQLMNWGFQDRFLKILGTRPVSPTTKQRVLRLTFRWELEGPGVMPLEKHWEYRNFEGWEPRV